MQLLQINGMTCEACIKLIKRKLARLEGVSEVIAHDVSENVQLISNKSYTKEEIQEALNGTPYTVVSVA